MGIFFFTIGNNRHKMPKGSSPENSNKDNLNKARKILSEADGKIFQGINLDKIERFLKISLESNSNIKIGHIMASIASQTIDSILHSDNENLALIHHNEKMPNSEVNIQRTFVYIGQNHNRKIKAYINGPNISKRKVTLVDSQCDWMDTHDRRNLKMECGINQRGISFLERSTFLSIQEILNLSDHEKHSGKIKAQLKNKLKTAIKENIEQGIDFDIKNLKKKKNEKGIIHYFSGLLETEAQLKIMNRMPVYDANVIVHMVRLKSMNSNITTVQGIMNDMCHYDQENQYLERIKGEDIFDKIIPNAGEINFKRQLITALKINPTNVETFKKNCILVKSWRRKIPSGGHWYINIREKFRDGIYLNKLEELKANKIDQTTPSSYFLMVEFYGDNRASVLRTQDEQTISSIYSPCILNFEYKFDIKYLHEDLKPDEIINYVRPEKDTQFEDEALADEFYPKREIKFNVNIENVMIGNEKSKKNAKYQLELNSSILEAQQLSQMDKLISKINNIDPKMSEDLTEDDLPFLSKEEDSDGHLRKKSKAEKDSTEDD